MAPEEIIINDDLKNDLIKFIVAVNDANIAIIDFAVSRSLYDLEICKSLLSSIQPLENALFNALDINVNISLEELRDMI